MTNELTPTTPEDRVLAGAAFLDDKDPEWFHAINLDMLNLSSACACVLGQYVTQYNYGYSYYSVVPGDVGCTPAEVPFTLSVAEAIAYGFHGLTSYSGYGNEDHVADEWNRLTAEWRTQIEKRLAEAGALG